MNKLITPIKRYLPLFVTGFIISALLVVNEYFPESTFELASESRLPKWTTVPPGLTRADVSLTLSYLTLPWRDAKFILQDSNKRTIEKKNGSTRCRAPFQLKNAPQGFPSGYPNYEAISVNGVTEILEQRKPEPILYVTDDPIVWKQYESIGCG